MSMLRRPMSSLAIAVYTGDACKGRRPEDQFLHTEGWEGDVCADPTSCCCSRCCCARARPCLCGILMLAKSILIAMWRSHVLMRHLTPIELHQTCCLFIPVLQILYQIKTRKAESVQPHPPKRRTPHSLDQYAHKNEGCSVRSLSLDRVDQGDQVLIICSSIRGIVGPRLSGSSEYERFPRSILDMGAHVIV